MSAKRAGRPPGPEGTAKRYTVMLSPVQVRRALSLGATINQGVNAALRHLVPDAHPADLQACRARLPRPG